MKIVTVSSVKGGTGKTLIAINTAYYLKQRTKRNVVLIDADFDSSNFAEFAGISDGRVEVDPISKRFIPFEWEGLKVFSVSLLADKEKAVSMRGETHRHLLEEIVENTNWGRIDYLVVDLPAGASDVFRSTVEFFHDDIVGGIIVTLPTTIVDAKRVIKLHLYNDIPVIGLIENMAWFDCPHCGQRIDVFGESIGKKLAEEFEIDFLGQIPLSQEIALSVRNGNPVLPDKYNKPVLDAVDKITKMKTLGFFARVKKKFGRQVKELFEKIIAQIVIFANKEIDIPALQAKYHFDEGLIFDFVLTNPEKTHVLSRTHFKVQNGKLVVVKNPSRVDFEIIVDFQTMARMVMGRRKLSNGKIVPYDPFDAYLNNDIIVYGRQAVSRGVYATRCLFHSDVMEKIRERFGKILSRFI